MKAVWGRDHAAKGRCQTGCIRPFRASEAVGLAREMAEWGHAGRQSPQPLQRVRSISAGSSASITTTARVLQTRRAKHGSQAWQIAQSTSARSMGYTGAIRDRNEVTAAQPDGSDLHRHAERLAGQP